jgi:hypothetical protein
MRTMKTKRRRTMLLCVTATSMAAVVGCTPSPDEHPVGTVAHPVYEPPPQEEAGPSSPADPADAAAATAPTARTPVDASAPQVIGRAPLHPPDVVRVGTTAEPPDTSPEVGTTARVPDTKKK